MLHSHCYTLTLVYKRMNVYAYSLTHSLARSLIKNITDGIAYNKRVLRAHTPKKCVMRNFKANCDDVLSLCVWSFVLRLLHQKRERRKKTTNKKVKEIEKRMGKIEHSDRARGIY